GYIAENGGCELALSDKQLIDGASELLHSLGIKHTVKRSPATYMKNGKRFSAKDRWRMHFVTTLPIFLLDRKAARMPKAIRQSSQRRFITSITPIETRPVRCIGVDSENHLFLAGETMTPTHNSLSYLTPA